MKLLIHQRCFYRVASEIFREALYWLTQEGTRPLLVEVQALARSKFVSQLSRRLCVGLDPQRLVMLLAVLHRHGGVSLGGHDVFVNVAGGIRVTDSGADVAVGRRRNV